MTGNKLCEFEDGGSRCLKNLGLKLANIFEAAACPIVKNFVIELPLCDTLYCQNSKFLNSGWRLATSWKLKISYYGDEIWGILLQTIQLVDLIIWHVDLTRNEQKQKKLTLNAYADPLWAVPDWWAYDEFLLWGVGLLLNGDKCVQFGYHRWSKRFRICRGSISVYWPVITILLALTCCMWFSAPAHQPQLLFFSQLISHPRKAFNE
jgi:hypothetical protein